MRPQLDLHATNIVLRGQFNAAIFHPSWFAAQDLMRQQEAEAAEIEVVHPEAAVFQVEWLQVRITRDRFQVATTQEPYFEALRDLVVGTFDLLRHTPLRVLGINQDFHYRLESEDAWHAVGHRLAPKKDWQKILNEPGMMSLAMQGQRSDDLDGYIRVKVEPSPRTEFGVYVNVNDHYGLQSASDMLIDILSEQWDASMQRGLQIAEHIVRLEDPR